ncbi:sodium/iodide cotransporter-like isoform X1 [Dermacentor albipictus]|uniref:sodium/iodide cotransporter-like isoform X1 n=1 Tax=Dermacentor albipictus TaxID=60249 RepID=UPI0038FCD940
MSPPESLGAADCAVFGVLTALGYLVGLYFSIAHRRRQVGAAAGSGGAATEVFLGGRSLPEAALTVSLLASIVNGVTVVGFLGHFYAHGFHLMWVLTGIPLAMIITSTTLVPLLYDMKAASIFQFLRLRFDNKVGITACIIYFVLSQTLGAVGIYSAAIGISTMFSFPLLYANIAIGLAGTIYTALGGLRSVVWADCVQALVMLASPAIIIGKVIYDSGSASPPLRPMSDLNVTEYILRTNVDLTSDENVWTALAGALPYSLARTGFDQMAVQRFMAARTLREAKRIVITGALFVLSFFALAAFGALAIVYWYRDCDPVLAGVIRSFDQHGVVNRQLPCGHILHRRRLTVCQHERQDSRERDASSSIGKRHHNDPICHRSTISWHSYKAVCFLVLLGFGPILRSDTSRHLISLGEREGRCVGKYSGLRTTAVACGGKDAVGSPSTSRDYRNAGEMPVALQRHRGARWLSHPC